MANATVGTITYDAQIDTSEFTKGAKQIDKTAQGLGTSVDGSNQRISGSYAKMGAAIGLVSGVVQSVVGRAMNSISDAVGSAVRRVDTLKNADRTFQNMGFSSEETKKAMDNLKTSILGLPTPLDSAVRGMTSLAATYGDVQTGQKIFTALNNAILGFGGTASEVDNAIQQLSQLPMDGPLDAQTWMSLRNSGLTPVLVAMAKDMGISVNEMKEKFGEGQLTVKDFTDELIKLDKNGGGGLKSLEKIAKDSTSGIGTGFANMQTAISRGLAGIVQAIGANNIAGAAASIGTAFEKSANIVVRFVNFLKSNQPALAAFTGAVLGLAVAVGVALAPAVFALATAFGAAVIAAAPFILIGAAIGLVGLLIIKHFDAIKNAVMGAFNWVKDNWPLLIGILTGPIGWATVAIVKNFDTIKQAFLNVKNWVSNLFVKVGEMASNAFKGVVNGVITAAENTVNKFIRAINGAVGAINKLPGVSIGKLSEITVPRLAEGGIVPATNGGRLAMIGEGGQDEAVIPLDKLDSILGKQGSDNSSNNVTINVDMNGIMARSRSDLRSVAKDLIESVNEELRAKQMPTLGSA